MRRASWLLSRSVLVMPSSQLLYRTQMVFSQAVVVLLVATAVVSDAGPTRVYKHAWDTVADVMAMHGKLSPPPRRAANLTATISSRSSTNTTSPSRPLGKFGSPDDLPPASSIDFMAANYGMITTGGDCSRSGAVTLEDGVLAVAAGIKAKNAKALVSGELQRAHGGGKCIKAP